MLAGRRVLSLALWVVTFLTSLTALTLTPPWSPKELKRGADLIVKGEVGEPVKQISVDKMRNADVFSYVVPLKITKVIKSKGEKIRPGRTIELFFRYYDYKEGIVGDQWAQHSPGEKGKYYLKKMEDGRWRQVHWSGVIVSK